MRKILATISLILFSATFLLYAQKSAPIGFEKTIHDFGKVKEDGGKVRYNFKFRNGGKQPIIIKNVQSSCGCTTPEWTRTPVLPGKEGFVAAEFDPTNLPGAFSKQVMVFNNITNDPIVLEIKGDVVPKVKQLEDIYRYTIGDLRLVTNHVAFARMLNSEKKTQSIDIVNNSDKNITIGFVSRPDLNHLKIIATPNVLKPKQAGKIQVDYDATKKDAWGFTTDKIILTINNNPVSGFPLSVSSSIIEDFSVLSASELANAPTMDFSNLEYNFGTIKQGTSVNYEFKFKNNGKRDLIIRDTQSSCGCTAVETKKVIKPGETSAIKVIFHSAGKSGNQNRSITLITNIPGKDDKGQDKYRIVLRIKGIVNT